MGAAVVSAFFAVALIFWKIANAPITTLVLLFFVSFRLYKIEQKFQKKKDRDTPRNNNAPNSLES